MYLGEQKEVFSILVHYMTFQVLPTATLSLESRYCASPKVKLYSVRQEHVHANSFHL